MPDAPFPDPTSLLTREDPEGVAILTLNRPRAGNSLSRELTAALDRAFAALADDRSVRSVVLAGAGHIFCSGHDLKEFQAHRGDAAFFRTVAAECSAMMQKIPALPQPVIARVHGVPPLASSPVRPPIRGLIELNLVAL